MLNPLTAYAEAGRKAAEAMNQRDQSRHDFQSMWFRRARGLENESDRAAATQAYEQAYKAARIVPSVSYFR